MNTEDKSAALLQNRKIRAGAVSYLNTKPLVYGLEKGLMKDELSLMIDHPANIARALLDDTIDIGLVPVAIIPQLDESYIDTNYCIASDGEVASVCLFSEVPIEQVTTVLLDYQSRSSVLLAKYLFGKYWKLDPSFEDTEGDFIGQIKGTVAAVIIGDRALKQRKASSYVYDLGSAWKELTGLPFVFATWVSNKQLSSEFIARFNAANQYGLDHLDDVIQQNPFSDYDLETYFKQNIRYIFDDKKQEGLQKFLSWYRSLQPDKEPVYLLNRN